MWAVDALEVSLPPLDCSVFFFFFFFSSTIQKESASLIMRRHTLQESQSITDSVRRTSSQLGRV